MSTERKQILVKALRVSDNWDEYDLVKKPVGTGGYGTVYKAKRKSDKKTVAMKFFGYVQDFPGRRSSKPDIDLINREVTLMMSLIGVPGMCS
jgi:serine/threonine protein kinase